MTDTKTHWSGIYQTKAVDNVSWYQDRPDVSLDFIRRTGVDHTARIIDVGAGASTLVDYLLLEGYREITLLDLSSEAQNAVRQRLGEGGSTIHYIEGDVTAVMLPENGFDIWHDRAVFHFLTDPALRGRYVESARCAVRTGGHLIIATFALDGPAQCSGLDVARYDAERLQTEFGNGFDLVESANETHVTPWGSEQKFVYCRFRAAKR